MRCTRLLLLGIIALALSTTQPFPYQPLRKTELPSKESKEEQEKLQKALKAKHSNSLKPTMVDAQF